MPFGDGIPKTRSFSLTDFHNFEYCSFKFFVFHHLDKKYELSKGNESQALGNVLDKSIKLFHKSKAYGQPTDYLPNIINRAVYEIREKVAKNPDKKSFYSDTVPFLTPELIEKAIKIFQNYYDEKNKKIKQSIGQLEFSEVVIEGQDGKLKLWGGADTLEMGDDGVPEVVDYKSKEDIEKGKEGIGGQIDLMSKIYILLAAQELLNKGYTQARFVVRFWQDPKEDGFYEEFDLTTVNNLKDFFKEKIERILSTQEMFFCEKDFCVVCQAKDREVFIAELEKLGVKVGQKKIKTGEEFLQR